MLDIKCTASVSNTEQSTNSEFPLRKKNRKILRTSRIHGNQYQHIKSPKFTSLYLTRKMEEKPYHIFSFYEKRIIE